MAGINISGLEIRVIVGVVVVLLGGPWHWLVIWHQSIDLPIHLQESHLVDNIINLLGIHRDHVHLLEVRIVVQDVQLGDVVVDHDVQLLDQLHGSNLSLRGIHHSKSSNLSGEISETIDIFMDGEDGQV